MQIGIVCSVTRKAAGIGHFRRIPKVALAMKPMEFFFLINSNSIYFDKPFPKCFSQTLPKKLIESIVYLIFSLKNGIC